MHRTQTPLRVLERGASWIAFDKPAGLLSVPGRGEANFDSVLSRVRVEQPGAEAPHRLDMDTSGVIVVATAKEAQRSLSAQFRHGRVEKRYVAEVCGTPTAEGGLIDLPIGRRWEDRPRRCIDIDEGKPAQTEWWVIAPRGHAGVGVARLGLRPLTGRTHQLRVHLAAVGLPIVGDPLYGRALDSEVPGVSTAVTRMLLHAEHLEFDDPDTGVRVAITCAPSF